MVTKYELWCDMLVTIVHAPILVKRMGRQHAHFNAPQKRDYAPNEIATCVQEILLCLVHTTSYSVI